MTSVGLIPTTNAAAGRTGLNWKRQKGTINIENIKLDYIKLRIQLKLNTALPSTVRVSVTGVPSHISHIYKGINAMLIIRGPIKPCIFWIKIILAIFLALTLNYQTYKCWIRSVYFVLFFQCFVWKNEKEIKLRGKDFCKDWSGWKNVQSFPADS